jgi:glycerol-1-phosphate dehydrogenase [NAD(P)+]
MELSELLGTSFACECGRTHHVPIRKYLYEPGAVDSLPAIIGVGSGNAPLPRVAVVADVRTWEVCGARVRDVLRQAGFDASRVTVRDRDHRGPMCDDVTSRWLVEQLQPLGPDIVVAVGSGVVNDLCKWSSFDRYSTVVRRRYR